MAGIEDEGFLFLSKWMSGHTLSFVCPYTATNLKNKQNIEYQVFLLHSITASIRFLAMWRAGGWHRERSIFDLLSL